MSCPELLGFGSELKSMALIVNGSIAILLDKLYLLMGIFAPDFSLDYYIIQGKISYSLRKIEVFSTNAVIVPLT